MKFILVFILLNLKMLIFEAISRPKVFCKKNVLKNFANSQEISFLNKIARWRLAAFLKKDSSTGVFPWILQKFWKHVF